MRLSARTLTVWGAIALGLSNLGRMPGGALGGRESPLILADLVTAAVCLFVVLVVATGRVPVTIDRTMAAVVGFLVAALISTGLALTRYSPGVVETFGIVAFLARWIAYFGWYPLIAWCLTRSEADDAWRDVERAILVFCIFGIFQSAFLPGFAQMLESSASGRTWDVQGRRLVSSVLDPNFAGIFIVIALLSRFARVAEGEHESGLVLGTLGTGLLLTLSRSSILAMVVGLGILAFTRGLRLRLVKVFLVGGLLLLPFISVLLTFASGFNKLGVDGSAAMRLIPWTRAVLLIRDHPWFGVGFNAITQAQQVRGWRLVGGAEATLDGGLLFVAAMTGLVGVLLYVRLLARVTGQARQTWRDPQATPVERAHASATAASIGAVVVHSLFVNSLLLPFVMQILWTMWGRLAHIVAARRARAGAMAALPLLLLVTACDPCAGTVRCGEPEEVAVTGSIVHHLTGNPIAGARVDAKFSSGWPPGRWQAVTSTVTDEEGLWTVRGTLPGLDSVYASFTVTAPGTAGYTVPTFAIPRATARGAELAVGAWRDVPATRFQGTVLLRGEPLKIASLWFEPTGGVHPVDMIERTPTTNEQGTFEFVMRGPQVGLSYGNLVVDHPDLGERVSLKGFPIGLEYKWSLAKPIVAVDVAPHSVYGGGIVFLGTLDGVPRAEFHFERTGGIRAMPDTFTAVAGPGGYFKLQFQFPQRGDMIGDVTIRPPQGHPQGEPRVYRDVRFAKYDSLHTRFNLWGFGEAWRWQLELRRASTGEIAPFVPVEFRRTGGLMTTPEHHVIHTDSAGRFRLQADVLDTGTVIGDITVKPPGEGPYIIRDVRLRTNPDLEFHFGGVHYFGPAQSP